VLALLLSRWALAFLIVRYPYARAEGSGAAFRSAGPSELAAATLVAVAGSVLLAGPAGIGALALTLALAVGLAGWAVRRVPGLTGDLYGAIGLLCEIGVLVLGTRLGGDLRF
jgi:adenosylcobinamide-GDP ribazoletransferase